MKLKLDKPLCVWYYDNMMRVKDGWSTVKFLKRGVEVACLSIHRRVLEFILGCSVTTASLLPINSRRTKRILGYRSTLLMV